MNILVTGGAGFIGSHLCDVLLAKGHKVTVVDNLVLGRKENIAHLIGRPDFKFIKEDLLHDDAMRRIFQDSDFEMVFHLAANSDIQKGGKNPMVDYDLTFNTTFHVLQYMKEFGIKALLCINACNLWRDIGCVIRELWTTKTCVQLWCWKTG